MNEKSLPPLPTPKFTETIRGVPCITVTEHEHLMRTYALQASALRPVQVPMTMKQIEDMALQEQFLLICDGLDELTSIVEAIEAHHGISAQAKKEVL